MSLHGEQRARALKVVNKVRGAFNDGGCRPIYSDAAGYFKAEEFEDWLDDCRNLKNEWGSWKSFELKSASKCGKPEFVVCLTGLGDFEKERTEVRIAVQLNADRDRHWTQSPHWSSPARYPLSDPPPRKSPKDGLLVRLVGRPIMAAAAFPGGSSNRTNSHVVMHRNQLDSR
jgi:hypothetical protein